MHLSVQVELVVAQRVLIHALDGETHAQAAILQIAT
jgi:hypothetical protein